MVESQNCWSSACFFLSFFFRQSAQCHNAICVAFEITTNCQEILWGYGRFTTCAFFAEKTEGAECSSCWIPFISAHMQGWHINQICMGRTMYVTNNGYKLIKKRTEISLHKKRFQQGNLADIGMSQSMNACTGWQSTQTRSACKHTEWYACTPSDMHALHNMQWPHIFNNLFCYLCRECCWICGHVMECISLSVHITQCFCLCTCT